MNLIARGNGIEPAPASADGYGSLTMGFNEATDAVNGPAPGQGESFEARLIIAAAATADCGTL